MAPDTHRCLGCANLRHALALKRHIAEGLQHDWSRQLFHDFVRDVGIERIPGSVIVLMKRNLEGFQRLDQTLSGPESLTVTSVLTVFADDTTNRRFRVIKHWLGATYGLDFNGEEAELFWHRQKLERLRASIETPWILTELDRFYAVLTAGRMRLLAARRTRGHIPLTWKSLLLATKYAAWFMQHCARNGAESPLSITQSMVEAYAVERVKCFHGVSAFIRHLNRHHHRFQRLTLPERHRARSTIQLRLTSEKRMEIVQSWLAAREGMPLRNACIALLCMFYLQRPARILALRRHHLRRNESNIALDFGQGFEDIDPEIAVTVCRWLDAWHHHSRFSHVANNDFLFPGTRPNRGYSSQAFSIWLKAEHGIRSRQLFATAVHGLIEAGLKDPSALVQLYGIPLGTAIKYWQDAGADLTTFLFSESTQAMRSNGDFDVA